MKVRNVRKIGIAVSTFVLVAALAMWIRSFWATDEIGFVTLVGGDIPNASEIRVISIVSGRGTIGLRRQSLGIPQIDEAERQRWAKYSDDRVGHRLHTGLNVWHHRSRSNRNWNIGEFYCRRQADLMPAIWTSKLLPTKEFVLGFPCWVLAAIGSVAPLTFAVRRLRLRSFQRRGFELFE